MSAARFALEASRLGLRPLPRALSEVFPLPRSFNSVAALYAAADRVNAFCRDKSWVPDTRHTHFPDMSSQDALIALSTLPASRLEYSTVVVLNQSALEGAQRQWKEEELRAESAAAVMQDNLIEAEATFQGQLFEATNALQELTQTKRALQQESARFETRETLLQEVEREYQQAKEMQTQIRKDAAALRERASAAVKKLRPEWQKFWPQLKFSLGVEFIKVLATACILPQSTAQNLWNKNVGEGHVSK